MTILIIICIIVSGFLNRSFHMNESFFYALEKAKLIWKKISEILFPNLNPETKVKQLLLSMFVWSIILCPTTVPISNVCLFLADFAGKGTFTGVFWLLTGMLALSAGFFASLFLLISIPSSVIWFIFTKIKLEKRNKAS